MLLPEYKGKALLRGAGIPTLQGRLARSGEEMRSLLNEGVVEFPAALKAQVASGGRGKQGGVRRVDSPDQAVAETEAIFDLRFDGEQAEAVLLEPWTDIRRELYLSIVVDGSAEGYMALYAPKGGVEIESGPAPTRYAFGVPSNFRPYLFRDAIKAVEEDGKLAEQVASFAHRLVRLAASRDCTSVEINPLAVTAEGGLVALDAKIVRDEWASYRQADILEEISLERARQPELVQDSLNMNHMYVRLDGDIGVLSGGAGMTMCAMDMIAQLGGRPACFLDCSPGPTSARGYKPAFDMLDADPGIRAILVSVYGGGTQMQRVAGAMKSVMAERTSRKPVVFRLNGTNVDQANEIMAEMGVQNHKTLESAVKEVIHVAVHAA